MKLNESISILNARDLSRLNVLQGVRELRTFEYYHARQYGYSAGHTSLKFFNQSGQQKDYSGTVGAVSVSNMIEAEKFDEPFLLTKIGLIWISGMTDLRETGAYDTLKVLSSGKLTLKLNNREVFSIAPLGRVGTVLYMDGFGMSANTGSAFSYLTSGKEPTSLDPYFYCEEGIQVSVELNWTSAVTINTENAWLGVYLIGGKYFKR